jgi:DnaJ-class molecular chaperone
VEPESAETHGDGEKRYAEKRLHQARPPSECRGKGNKKSEKAEDERGKGQRLPRKKAVMFDPSFYEEKDESRGENEGDDSIESPTAGCRR